MKLSLDEDRPAFTLADRGGLHACAAGVFANGMFG